MRQRDIDALRAGIAEQVRSEVEAEHIRRGIDRSMQRVLEPEVELRRAAGIKVGDVICATDNGRSFYQYAKVTGLAGDVPTGYHVRVSAEHSEGGRSQTTYKDDELVLLRRR